MANILLTEKCVRSCPYCFAEKHMKGSVDNNILQWDDLIYIADFLKKSNENHISLLGGEPTLHPNFVEFVIYLLERNFFITIFTSGIMAKDKLKQIKKYLSKVEYPKISFIVNVNEPNLAPKNETKKAEDFLREFGHVTTLSFNIYHTKFDMDFLIDYINKFACKRYVRIGLAHPIPNEKNNCIPVSELPKMAKQLMTFVKTFLRMNVMFGFDCGMPMCLYNDEELALLYKVCGGNISFNCGAAIDIGPDMNVWACFPLSRLKKSLYDFNSFKEIKDFFGHLHEKLRNESGGIMIECDTCKYRENRMCQGGCLAHVVTDTKTFLPNIMSMETINE